MKTKKVRTSVLLIGLTVGLAFSLFIGIVGASIGLASLFPQMNLVAGPFVCPGQQMSYQQDVSNIGSDTYYTATWFCVDEQSGVSTELDSGSVVRIAGPMYGVVIFAILLLITYLYWNSSIGPARNDGLYLW